MTSNSSHYNNRNRINKFQMSEKERENKERMTNIIEDIIGNKKKRKHYLLKTQNDSKNNSKYP